MCWPCFHVVSIEKANSCVFIVSEMQWSSVEQTIFTNLTGVMGHFTMQTVYWTMTHLLYVNACICMFLMSKSSESPWRRRSST